MRIKKYKGSILIISNRIVTILSKLTGLENSKEGKPAMGFAVFPFFIFLRNLDHDMTKFWINHELIHLKQFKESLGIFFVISQLEYIYARLFLKYSHLQAYVYEAIEHEAYLNQGNLNYLNNRKWFSTIPYYFSKRKFHTNEKYELVID